MNITEELLKAIYQDNSNHDAYYFIDGMLFAAKEYGHITEQERQEWSTVNDNLYDIHKYDNPAYDD